MGGSGRSLGEANLRDRAHLGSHTAAGRAPRHSGDGREMVGTASICAAASITRRLASNRGRPHAVQRALCHSVEMSFDTRLYGGNVAAILDLDGGRERLMPLTRVQCSSEEARLRLGGVSATHLFPHARAPEAALSGLYVYFSCWDEAHTIAQDLSSAEGSFWHGIVHRLEPDAESASYWFRRVGSHPIFPRLQEEAVSTLATYLKAGATWDPFQFIELCERARSESGSELERQLMIVQRTEWQLLFDYCAGH